MTDYVYLGDRLTDPALRGMRCSAVRRPDGKCIRAKNGSMLVIDEAGNRVVVIGRLLRKIKDEAMTDTTTTPADDGLASVDDGANTTADDVLEKAKAAIAAYEDAKGDTYEYALGDAAYALTNHIEPLVAALETALARIAALKAAGREMLADDGDGA